MCSRKRESTLSAWAEEGVGKGSTEISSLFMITAPMSTKTATMAK